MSMKYIRDTYGVPAKRGARIEFRGDGRLKAGTVVNAIGPYLRVRIDGGDIVTLHPTWEVTYPGALSASNPPDTSSRAGDDFRQPPEETE